MLSVQDPILMFGKNHPNIRMQVLRKTDMHSKAKPQTN